MTTIETEVTTMEEKGYQGWANYPTWAVNLWLSNDEGLYTQRREMAAEAIANAADDRNVSTGIWTVEETQRYRLADALKDWVRDDLAPDLEASFAADLLGWAFGQVNWNELADAAIEDVRS